MYIPFLLHFGMNIPKGASANNPADLPQYPGPVAAIGTSPNFARADHKHPFQNAEDTPNFLEWTIAEIARAGGNLQGWSELPALDISQGIATLTPVEESFLVLDAGIIADDSVRSIALADFGTEVSWLWVDTSGELVHSSMDNEPPAWLLVAKLEWEDGSIKTWENLLCTTGLSTRCIQALREWAVGQLELKFDKAGGTVTGDTVFEKDVTVEQALEVQGKTSLGEVEVSDVASFVEDVSFQKDIFVAGSMNTVDAQTLEVEDNFILLNKGEEGPGVTAGSSGVEVDRGTEDNYRFQFSESSGTFQIGKEDSLQDVATRLGLINKQLVQYDAVNKTLVPAQLAAETGDSETTVMSQKATTDALVLKSDKAVKIQAGTGISGGGDLSEDRTLSVVYGVTSGTALEGDALVQEEGDSQVKVMSQKATTNAIEALTAENIFTSEAKVLTIAQKLDQKLDASALTASLVFYMTNDVDPATGYNELTKDAHDLPAAAVVITSPAITTGADTQIGAYVSPAFDREEHLDNVSLTISGAIRLDDQATATAAVRFELYKLSGGVETKIAESGFSATVGLAQFYDISVSAIIAHVELDVDDQLVIKYFAKKIGTGTNPKVRFRVGGADPMRAALPVSVEAVLPAVLPIEQGGTGAETAQGARANLELPSALDYDLTVTVGSGGVFATINAALKHLAEKYYPVYKTGGFTAEIKLLSGFVMQEQVLVSGVDLGWITITADDAVVNIQRSSLTSNECGDWGLDTWFPAFGGSNCVMPVIGALFKMDSSGEGAGRHGYAIAQTSKGLILPKCGVTHAGDRGIAANSGSTINADSANASNAGDRGIFANRGSTINARDAAGTLNIAKNTLTASGVIFQ